MKELEKVNKTLEEIEDVKIYINQAYMKNDLLEKQIERLEEDKGQIIFESDLKIKALEEMIEKMKCCYNCSKWDNGRCKDVEDSFSYFTADFSCDDWELEE